MLRRWRLVRQRALALRLPAADPSEELRSISNLVKPLERKHDSLRLLRIQPAVTQATTTGVELVLECTGAELRTLAADEHVKINKRAVPSGRTQTQTRDPKREPNKTKRVFHKRQSGCHLGDACPYVHEGPSGANKTEGSKALVGA